MSGNPFRKPQSGDDGGPAGAAAAPKSKGRVKKVQFVSPVASPQEPPSHPRFPSLEELDDGPKSPSPESHANDSYAVNTRALLRDDPTAGDTIDFKSDARNESVEAASASTRQITTGFQLGEPPAGRRGAPANPFSRTLATIDRPATGMPDIEGAKQKPLMDVDAFKRLLLTGKPDAHPQIGANTGRENGSSTDSSFVSKQSLSDSLRETRSDSSISSTSSLEDESSEDEINHNEESADRHKNYSEQIASTIRTSLSRLESIPQTVSFDDFEEAALQPSHVEEAQTTPSLHPTRLSRAGSDSNKQPPVPPSPRVPGTPTTPVFEQQSKKGTQPPPPPSSRRQAQSKSVTRTRSSSNVDQAPSIPEVKPDDSQPTHRPKPPPPRAPASRSRRTPSISESISSDSVPTLQAPDSSDVSVTTKPKPPLPPSRLAAKQPQLPLGRTLSSSSFTANRRTSPSLATSVPPPPPPRRGEGKRSSIDGTGLAIDSRRSSIHSTDVERRDSVSSVQRAAEGGQVATAKSGVEYKAPVDMLADLDAFQREVDALRARALAGK